jgi:hypothetical protein
MLINFKAFDNFGSRVILIYHNHQPPPLLEPLVEPVPSLEMGEGCFCKGIQRKILAPSTARALFSYVSGSLVQMLGTLTKYF